jgi:hypothetical protein
LVASIDPVQHDVELLRARLVDEPYARAMRDAWRVTDLEGLFAHFVARPSFARAIANTHQGPLNTDDRAVVEFGFARGLGRDAAFSISKLIDLASARGERMPPETGLDTNRVRYEHASMGTSDGDPIRIDPSIDKELRERLRVQALWSAGDGPAALAAWSARVPSTPLEEEIVAELLAGHGDVAVAREALMRLHSWNPAAAEGLLALVLAREGRLDDAVQAFTTSLVEYRHDPWPLPMMMRRVLATAGVLAQMSPRLAPRLLRALDAPFAVHLLDHERLMMRLTLAGYQTGPVIGRKRPPDASCAPLVSPFEPNTPWSREFLEYRHSCYASFGPPAAAARADTELAEFLRDAPADIALSNKNP